MNLDDYDYKVIRKENANDKLIEKLKSFKSLAKELDTLNEWEQLIAIGGFVADVVRLLKWEKHTKEYRDKNLWYDQKANLMTYNDISEEILTAIDTHLNLPYADELNAIWRKWNTDDTYLPEVKREDVIDIIVDKLEENYPELLSIIDKYFHFSEENNFI